MTALPPPPPPPPAPLKHPVPPTPGEVITSQATGNTYTMGEKIGEGGFGVVYACKDVWQNDLAAKVLKPVRTYSEVQSAAVAELGKLIALRSPFITFIFDAFEYRDTFFIITERCYCPVSSLFTLPAFNGRLWLLPIARCLLQAVQYVHIGGFAHQDIHSGNVFAAVVKDEVVPTKPAAMLFKLGDLGVAKLVGELDAANTRAQWMLPPEVLSPSEFGPLDRRIDIYHLGLLFLEFAQSRPLRFSADEILRGAPREMALALPHPLANALEKALRRHVSQRTATAMDLWLDLAGRS
jgi:serine/threonine protein kinase